MPLCDHTCLQPCRRAQKRCPSWESSVRQQALFRPAWRPSPPASPCEARGPAGGAGGRMGRRRTQRPHGAARVLAHAPGRCSRLCRAQLGSNPSPSPDPVHMRSGAAAKLCRAHSGGRAARRFTYAPPNEDNMLAYADELRSQLVVLMGGRAAEMLTCEQARACRGRACPARVCAGEARRGGGATGTLTGSLCTPCRLPGLG